MQPIKIDQRIQDVLYGLVCHLDNALEDLAEARGQGVEPSTRELDAHIFLTKMGAVGFFEPMTLRMEQRLPQPGDSAPIAHIRDKDKTVDQELTFSPDFLPWFKEANVVYVEARFWPNGLLQLYKKLGDLQW